jgi:hypothetical protein
MNSYKHIATAATTVVKSGPSTLRDVIVNGGTTGIVTVYDGIDATGDVVAIIAAVTEPLQLTFDISMGKGITIVTAANTDVTITY